MNPSTGSGARLSDDVTRQAAAWFARLRADDVSGRDRASFEIWLREDFAHRAAYERFERFWSKSGAYAGERAVAHAIKRVRIPWPTFRWMAAAGIAALVMGILLVPRLLDENGVHETRIGQLRTLELADGSRVTLNTNTRVHVEYSEHRRAIRLDYGQAYFNVTKDLSRPFEVTAANGIVRAMGTEFEMYQQGEQLRVTLVEGKVAVRDLRGDKSSSTGPAKIMHPGQSMTLVLGSSARAGPARVERSTAWLARKLVFDDAPLEDAVAEANRYSRHQIKLADERLKALHISGVYRTGEPEEFVHAISSYFAINARQEANGDFSLMSGTARTSR